jgi:hypothetical protein
MGSNTEAYSVSTGKTYPSWDDLVAAEANGFVVTAVISDGSRTWTWTVGPFKDKSDANRARARLRTRLKREVAQGTNRTFQLFVRPAWKDLG